MAVTKKPIMIRPTEKGHKMITDAVEALVASGERCSTASFCHDAAIEKAKKILKKD